MAPSSKLDVAGMTSSCLMRQSKCGWKVVNQMPKTTPIDFLAYKKRIGINHQQLEICGVGFTPFPSISTKIWCDVICRTNMHQRWYDFFWLCRTMGPNVITSWPEKQQLIALLWVFFQCRTLCKSTCSLSLSAAMIPHVQVRKVPGLDTRWQDRVDGSRDRNSTKHGFGRSYDLTTWPCVALKKIGTCFLICIPGPLGFRPAKNMAVITWICATVDACESSWIRFFACILGSGWRETQEFSQIEQVFRKKWVARRTSTRWNTRYIIDPSSEMLWARIQYSRYIPGIYWYYSIYSMSCQILSDQSKNFRQMREASPARLTLVQNVRDVRNNSE